MRLAVVLAFGWLACATPLPLLERGVEALETSGESGVLEFYLVHPSYGSSCFECILIDLVEDQEREALYVDARPSCRLTREGVEQAEFGPLRDDFVVALQLNRNGLRALRPCMPPDGEHLEPNRFLLVLGGSAVGTEFVYAEEFFGVQPILMMHGGPELEVVFAALYSAPSPAREL